MRWLPPVACGGATVIGFLLALVVAIAIHLHTPSARRVVVRDVNAALAPLFRGKIRIERLGGLGLFGISGTDVTIEDPEGRIVLVAHGARVHTSMLAVGYSALFGKNDPLAIRLSDVSIDSLDVRLDSDAGANLDLARAFEFPKPSTPANPNARGVRLAISRIALAHGWVHGHPKGAPVLDVDVDDLVGAFTYAPELLAADVSKATVAAHGIANGTDVRGDIEAHAKKLSVPRANVQGRVYWQGSAGGIGHSIRASLDGDHFDAVVDAPEVKPEGVRTFWPSSPIVHAANVHASASGALPNIDVDVRAGLGEAALVAKGFLALGEDRSAKLNVVAHDIDVREFAAAAPATRLALTGDVSATLKADGALAGDTTMRFLGGVAAGQRVPEASVRATMSRTAPDNLRAHADVIVHELSLPTHLTARLFPSGASSAIEFTLDADAPELDRVPWLHHAVQGTSRLAARGVVDLGRMTVNANLEAAAERIGFGAITATSAAIDGRARGALASPLIDVAVHSKEISTTNAHFTSVDVVASGAARSPHVTLSAHGADTPNVDASADVKFANGVTLHTLRVALARAGENAIVTADRLSVGGGDIRVDQARIEGLGEPATASLMLGQQELRVRASSSGVDLSRVGRIVHVENTLGRGTLAFDADVDLRSHGAFGRGSVNLKQARIANMDDVAAEVRAEFDGRKFAGKAHVQAGKVGFVDLETSKFVLGGTSAVSLSAWRQAWGDIAVDAHVDLGQLASALPPDRLPLSEAHGDIVIKGHVVRDDLDDLTPDVQMSLVTNHLVLAPKIPMTRDIDGVLVMERPPWRLAGVDVTMDTSIDGDTGALQVATQLRDAKGQLADIHASSAHFPYGDLLHDTGALAASLRRTPFELTVAIPERWLGGLPQLLKQNYVTGRFHGSASFAGTLLSPKVQLSAALRQSRFVGTTRREPLEFDLSARYDGARGDATVKARSAGRELLALDTRFDGAAADFLDGHGGAPDWRASARAHVVEFPLDAIAYLDDKLVSGQVTGDVSVEDLHKDARANIALAVDSLRVGSVGYNSAHIQANADGRVVDGTIRIDQVDGFAETNAHAAATWGAAIAPVLDPERPLDVAVATKNFRIAGLLPFVDKWLDELDGRLDGSTRIELDPKSRRAILSGGVALSHGTLEATAGGGEFHDIAANVDFLPDGVIALQKLTAAGVTGHLEANGSARLDGATLQSANVVIVIPNHSPIPVTAAGSEIGDVDGRIEIAETASDGGKMLNVNVEVPRLRVALPEGSSKRAQALGPIPKVRIGAHRGHPLTFVLLPIDPVKPPEPPSGRPATRVDIRTHLAAVDVVRGTDLRVALTGRVDVMADGGTKVTGQIQLQKDGVLTIQGRDFKIEDGTVTFVGDDPSNPEVVVKAGWAAPDGTVVYANFVGPLHTGKVTLASEPPLPQQEIVELVLFGTTGGKQAQDPSATTADTALGTVGGEAAQPINHALNQLGLGAVRAKVDTTEASAPKPEVEVQIAKDISMQLAVVLGQPPPGVNPDRTLLTLDWRFLSRWSLSSTLGDAGTTIFDVLWQKRY